MTSTLLVFRLGSRWFAFPISLVKEVTGRRPTVRIPHRTNHLLRGVVNINGEPRLCISLHQLLLKNKQPIIDQCNRMIVIEQKGENWVFLVEEIEGTLEYDHSQIHSCPFEVYVSMNNYLLGKIVLEQKEVNVLDQELLFSSLRRSIQ